MVPGPEKVGKPAALATQLESLVAIMGDPAFVRLAPLLGLTAGCQIAIQTLWAGPWWRDVGGLDRAGVARHLLFMAAAFFVGVLSTGALADRLQRRGVSTLDLLVCFLLAFMSAQVLILFGVVELPAWLLFGMLGQVAVLAFPWLAKHFGAALSARANSGLNLTIFATAFLIQWAIGAIIDLYPTTPSGGFPVAAYRAAFGACLALQVAGLAFYLPAHRQLRRGRRPEAL